MSKKYKVVVSDQVTVKVKGALSDSGGKPVPFKFSLTCDRLDVAHFREAMEETGGDLKQFMAKVTTGWDGQRLVLEDDGSPAEYCEEAMGELMNITGMALLCFNNYQKESGAQEKN